MAALHMEDLGEARMTVPEDREARARRHLLAQQMVDVIVGEIVVLRQLDPDMPLTAVVEAATCQLSRLEAP